MYELELHLLIDDDPGKVDFLIHAISDRLMEDPRVDSVTAWSDPAHPVFDTTAAIN